MCITFIKYIKYGHRSYGRGTIVVPVPVPCEYIKSIAIFVLIPENRYLIHFRSDKKFGYLLDIRTIDIFIH